MARFDGFTDLCMNSHFVAAAKIQIPKPHSILIKSEFKILRIIWKGTVRIQIKNFSIWVMGEKATQE